MRISLAKGQIMKKTLLTSLLTLTLVGCNLLQAVQTQVIPTPTSTMPVLETLADTPSSTTVSIPTQTETSPPIPVESTSDLPDEAILILEPGPGSRLVSPIHVAGEADSTFEQSLVIRLVGDDGSELALVPVQIAAEMGQRGPFEADIAFSTDQERQAFIQVYTTSPRDGGVTHLAATGVLLLADGEPQIITRVPQPEQIVIFTPGLSEVVRGGVVHVSGFALASFEQTLLVEVLDADGNVVGAAPVIVDAPDLGQPGPFEVDLDYTVVTPGPGRIVVRDISPAFGGDTHLSSVEIDLEP
jgi:hypothetical protein